mgnify:CR=1 FL=1
MSSETTTVNTENTTTNTPVEPFRYGYSIHTSRLIDHMLAGKIGDTATRDRLKEICGRSVDHGTLGNVGISRGKTSAQHSAHRMPHDRGASDVQGLKQLARVERHIVKVVRDDRL